MIGWKPRPFIFVHIPKCAGTSIEKAFIPILTGRQDFADLGEEERSKHWLPGRKGLQHCKLKWYQNHFDIDDYLKFAVVRNPWDRAVSQIKYLRAKTGRSVFRGNNFKENVKIYCNASKRVWGHDLGACQADFLLDLSGNLKMDFIGKFESLSEDFNKICRMIGLEAIPKLPHIFNSMRTRHYSAFYDSESSDWIRSRFARDIDHFGYKFETSCTQEHKPVLV